MKGVVSEEIADLDFGDDREQREEEGVSAHEKNLLVVNCAEVK